MLPVYHFGSTTACVVLGYHVFYSQLCWSIGLVPLARKELNKIPGINRISGQSPLRKDGLGRVEPSARGISSHLTLDRQKRVWSGTLIKSSQIVHWALS